MRGLSDTAHMTARHLKGVWRQPSLVAITLVQPLIWLLLFGALFHTVTDIPGFASSNYIEFLAPGVIVMVAFFSGGLTGMPVVEDIDRGVLDRFLASPARRPALIAGRLTTGAVLLAVQAIFIIGLALIAGASFDNGVLGVVVLIFLATLISASFGCLSIGLALLIRQAETLIAIVQLVLLPISFISVIFMQRELMPGWMQTICGYNPLNWAVEAGREAVEASPDWGSIAGKSGLLLAFLGLCGAFAMRAFRTYQRSV